MTEVETTNPKMEVGIDMRLVRSTLMAFAIATWACSGGGGGGGGGNPPTGPPGGGGPTGDITLTASTFDPQNFNTQAGESFTWVNQFGVQHTITPDGHTRWQRTVVTNQGQQFTATINEPGTYPYHCEIHGFPGGGMHGTITVTQ